MTSILPQIPFHGQQFIDAQRTKWVWDQSQRVWCKIGTVDGLPVADDQTTGLMSAPDKILMDSIPESGGGFGFVVNTAASVSEVIQGDIELRSESLDIVCVDSKGNEVDGCPVCESAAGDLPGFKFKLSDKFLNTLCLKIVGTKGPKGDIGSKGATGTDGFNDGPAGDPGEDGIDATESHTFTDVKVVDSEELTDTGVVAVDLDGSSGKMTYTVAKLNVPDNETPAEQVIAAPVYRQLRYPPLKDDQYSKLGDWTLVSPSSDVTGGTDLLMMKLPPGSEVDKTLQLGLVKLSDYINLIVAHYQNILCAWEEEWEAEIKTFIEQKDDEARSILASLAQQVSECEFQMPLEFCLGIQNEDCASPRVNLVALVESRGATGGKSPLTIQADADHTGVTADWRVWPAPDIADDLQWDINSCCV